MRRQRLRRQQLDRAALRRRGVDAGRSLLLARRFADGRDLPEHGAPARRSGRLVGQRSASGHLRRASLRVHSGGAALAGCAAHVLERGDDRALQRRQFQFLSEGSAAAHSLQRADSQPRGTLPESGIRRQLTGAEYEKILIASSCAPARLHGCPS